ncbi:MAG TPA: TlpA family protein disulfide reductase, partial [Trinickia sp.]|nr:TlpA family protein disulfide reductase [Trinickia sp.]
MKTFSPVGTAVAVIAALAVGAGALYWVRAGAPKSGAAAQATTAPALASAPPDAVAELWQA